MVIRKRSGTSYASDLEKRAKLSKRAGFQPAKRRLLTCVVCRYDPLHADPLVRVERLQRDLWEGSEDAAAHAEVARGAGRLYRGAGAGGEVHAARVS